MVRNYVRPFAFAILLAAFPVTGWAQDAKAILSKAAQAMGTENLRTLQYSGSGSSYDDKGQHATLNTHSNRLDLNATPSGDWDTQLEFWLSPYGFLRGAAANMATVETKKVYGENYRIVSFTLPGNHKVSGFINDKDMVERVQTTLDNNVAIEGVYREYSDFGGVKVPTILIRNRAGNLSQVVIVKDAKPNG